MERREERGEKGERREEKGERGKGRDLWSPREGRQKSCIFFSLFSKVLWKQTEELPSSF